MDFIADQRLAPEPSKPLPWEYANVLLGERFGKWPEEAEDRPTDRALFYNGVLAAEAKAHGLIKGLQPGDVLILDDEGDDG